MDYPTAMPTCGRLTRLWCWALAAICLAAVSCSQSRGPAESSLIWATPAAISFGTALGPAQLNATAGVQGTFTYTPASGVCLPVGSHTLAVTFSPSDPAKYQSSTATVSLEVTKALPVILWPSPAPFPFGTPLSSAQLNARAVGIDGTFVYSPSAGAILPAGPQVLTATFTPEDSANYLAVSTTVTLTVNKATPVLYWPAPAPVAAGAALTSMQLDAFSNGIAGTFTYSPVAGSILPVGSNELEAAFTPSDSKDYETVTASQRLVVHDATPPSITVPPQDQTAAPGQAATFSVAATGAGALSYQWLKNSVPISGATFPTYSTTPVQMIDNGSQFTVVVSDSFQTATSSGARLTVTAPVQSTFYVATSGSDQSDGSAAAPFATLQRAQIAMQSSAIKVAQIESGSYYLPEPLILTDADAGETWEAAPDATVILSGGAVISGWTSEGNGVYSAHPAQPVGVDLTIAGARQIPADLGFDADEPYTSGWKIVIPNPTQTISNTFGVNASDLTASVKPGALIQIIDHCRWTDLFTRIVAVDGAHGTITTAAQFDTGTSLGYAGSWRVLNDPADLSTEGQFAYDSASSTVYVMPAGAADPNSEQVVAAQLGTLIQLNGTSGITIRGVTFSDTISDSVQASGAWDDSHAAIMTQGLSNSTISGNRFRNVGKAIVMSGSSGNQIVGNELEHLGVSGISLLSDSNHNVIAHNSIESVGEINLGSYGISINDSSNTTVDSNLIDGVGRWGIVFGPSGEPDDADDSNTGNVISNNVIRNTSNRTNDTGAIYGGAATVDGYLNESLLITGNRIENVGGLVLNSSGGYDAGFAQGIYLDDHLSGVTVTRNVIESGSSNGVLLCHGCKGNTATNNVVILQPAPVYDRGAYGSTFATGAMTYNGITRIDLLPSYFPEAAATSTIVVRLSGQSFNGTGAAFNVQVDGTVIGTGTATSANSKFVFKAAVTPHQVHRVGIALINGADAGATTTALHNLGFMVNNTAVSLAAPEAAGSLGPSGFAVVPDDLMVSNFSVTQNIIYRNGGLSMDVSDTTAVTHPGYVDPDPGVIDANLLFQNISPAFDAIMGDHLLDANSMIADPAFTNPSRGDYRIESGSAASSIGFTTTGAPLGP
jgi:parallel beta-helix repeat protein